MRLQLCGQPHCCSICFTRYDASENPPEATIILLSGDNVRVACRFIWLTRIGRGCALSRQR